MLIRTRVVDTQSPCKRSGACRRLINGRLRDALASRQCGTESVERPTQAMTCTCLIPADLAAEEENHSRVAAGG
jgi:hypothetical protein